MKWYERDAPMVEIDYSKPIAKKSVTAGTMLLLPCLRDDSGYDIIGYNWFRLLDGHWNSCRTWKTPQAAVDAYGGTKYCFNVEIDVEKIQ